jgi:hypothetical protein
MSSTIKIKRSNTSGNAPDTSNIVEGELALNTADGVLYSRGGNDIFEVGSNLTTADIDALVVNDSAQIDGKLEVSPSTASDTIALGSTSQTGTITLGQSTATNTINVGNGATASGSIQTVNIGGGNATDGETIVNIACIDSGDTTVKIGDPDGAVSGTKNIKLAGNVTTSNGNFFHNGNQFMVSPSNNASSILIGGNSHTGLINLGMGTGTQTTVVAGGNVASGSTKTLRLGTSGEAGSTTNIKIGNDDSASTTTLQGVTKIDRLGSKIKTPTGDNSVSSITSLGKLIKIVTIDTTTSGEYYNLVLDTYSRGAINSYDGDRICPTRSFFSLTSQGIGTTPNMALNNAAHESPFDREDHPELIINVNSDVAGDGSGPCRVEIYQRIYIPGSGVESFVISENGTAGVATWVETFAETDYQAYLDVAGISGYSLSSSGIDYILSTRCNKYDQVFGTTAGILKTTGGDNVNSLNAVAQSEGFLFYDSATETFSHTFDMIPSDPAQTIAIGDSEQTGTINFGNSKKACTVNVNSALTDAGVTRLTQIAAGAITACTNNVAIGSSNPNVNNTIAIYGTTFLSPAKPGDDVTIGNSTQTGDINIGLSTTTNTLKLNNGATASLASKTTKIGGGGAIGSTEILELGYNNQTAVNSTIKIGNEGTATNSVTVYGDTTFSNGDVSVDSNLDVGGTINGKYDTVFPFTSSTSMNLSDFKSNSGKKIISFNSSLVTIDADFQPTTDDIGKHWTLVAASTNAAGYINIDLENQYVRLMSGGSQYAQLETWRVGRGGVAELVCVGANASGGSQSSPNFILYGNDLDTL